MGRYRPADHLVLRPASPCNRVGQKHAPRKRRRDPVRESEVGIRLGQRGRDPPLPRGVDHRAGDVPAATEDDVGLPRGQDPAARPRRTAREQDRAQLRHPRPPRQAADPERVEFESRLGNEARLDPVRRAGEAHAHAAGAERLRDGERRHHVAGRPAGCDHAPKF